MKKISSAFLSMMCLCALTSHAQKNYALASGYSIVINGSSNLHDWKENANTASAALSINTESNGTLDITQLTFTVAVKGIKSTEGSIMNNKTYDALKADKFPSIVFKLSEPIKNIPANASGASVTAVGNLTMAGTTKPVTLHATVSAVNGKLEISGSQPLVMSTFGIAPPKAMLGTLKVKDPVTIQYKTTFVANN